MSYYREVRKDELVAWLLEKGYAEELPGYGHVSADELADALIARFDVLTTSETPR